MTNEQVPEHQSAPVQSPATGAKPGTLAPLLMQLVLAALVLSVGVYVAYYLFVHVDKPQRQERPRQARMVSVMEVQPQPFQIEIEAMGTVAAARTSVLQMETAGTLIRLADAVFPGSLIRKGDELLAVDDRAYKIAVAQRKAELAQQQSTLALERGNAAVAEKEFSLIGLEIKDEDRSLVLREPQLQAAQAAVEAARQALADAELDLRRCVLYAPYDCIVLEKYIDLGENIGAGTNLMKVVASEEFWVESLVSERDLRWLQLADDVSADVLIRHPTVWGADATRTARMLRVLPALEDAGRMARVLSVLKDPLAKSSAEKLPLRIGSFVETVFMGPRIEDALVLPSSVLHDDDVLWLVKDAVLRIQQVEVLWRNARTVCIASGLEAGDHIVTTPLNAVVDGMAVRVEGQTKAAAAEKDARP